MISKKCDAPQQNREQVAQAYFDKWAIEADIGVKNDSPVNFDNYLYVP